jgi:hypothetical protein
MTTDAQTVVRRAYNAAEDNVMDVQALSQLIGHLKLPEPERNTNTYA